MDLNIVSFFIIAAMCCIALVLFVWTFYEFLKLDKEQFKYYAMGLLFYAISVPCFFVQYIVLASLSVLGNSILSYFVFICPILGFFYFIKGTEHLAKHLNPEFRKNEQLYSIVLYLIIGMAIYDFYTLTALFSEMIYKILTLIGASLYLITAYLAMKLLLEYKNSFGGLFAEIIYHYILAAALIIVGGVIVIVSLQPMVFGDLTMRDLSYLRNATAVIGSFIIVLPFVICLKSVSKFRKLLMV